MWVLLALLVVVGLVGSNGDWDTEAMAIAREKIRTIPQVREYATAALKVAGLPPEAIAKYQLALKAPFLSDGIKHLRDADALVDAARKAGSGVIFDGTPERVPGIAVINYQDNPALRLTMGQDGRARRGGESIDLIVLHVTKGNKQEVLPGYGPGVGGERIANLFRDRLDKDGEPHNGGAHFLVDRDGKVYQLADAGSEVTYNASLTPVNNHSISIENQQGPRGELNEGQLLSCAILVKWLCDKAGVPFVYSWPYEGSPLPQLARRDLGGVRGIIGHRDSRDRGWGDPGDAVYAALKMAGATPRDFRRGVI